MEQIEYNMFTRMRIEKEYAWLYGEIGLITTVFCPLNFGILTGKYNMGSLFILGLVLRDVAG